MVKCVLGIHEALHSTPSTEKGKKECLEILKSLSVARSDGMCL